ncbi:amino acid/polyamine transporter I [Aspergillus caelatus]|uniref:Amino acid/polyamine transporter I n=1 Tax=Aspergillus caelatus TaxID=61420 RepID=A0A5N6ZIP0_9EURO|nr:amino acid/polyamine transporter I [Aspergillus caelatus]KAE8357497.1 amino acid/polyamine transporter I [Aspergillus caelatus]
MSSHSLPAEINPDTDCSPPGNVKNDLDQISPDFLDDGTIEAFGYTPVYRRVVGALVGFCIVISLTSPLGAIMVAGVYPITYAGYWGLSWGWLIPNIMMIPQVIAVAELCSSMPVNGAFYWWAAALAPRRASRPVAFIMGWLNVLSLATHLASFSYAVASSLGQTIGYFVEGFVATRPQLMGMAMGTVTLWASLMLLRLERMTLVIMTTATVLLLSCIAFVVALPATHVAHGLPFADAADVFGDFTNYSEWPENGFAVLISFSGALWVNSLWIAPVYVAEETQKARVRAPKAIIQSFGCTAIVGAIICLVFDFCIYDMDATALDETGFPLFNLIRQHWDTKGTAAFLLIGSVFSCLGGSGMLLTYATQIAAFARDGGLPLSRYLVRVHHRTNMPLFATALLVLVTYLLLLLSLSANASDIVYSMATLANLLLWCVPITLRLLAGGKWVPGPFHTGRLSWWIHLLAAMITAFFLIARAFPPNPDIPPLNVIVIAGVLVVAAAAFFFTKFRGLNLDALEIWRDEYQQHRGDRPM